MPKIISYTPPWLSRPAPGYHLFSRSSVQNEAKNGYHSTRHRRTIARRGTEVFVVVDNEIRWSDLCMLKDVWEEGQERNKNEKAPDENGGSNGDFGLADEDTAKRSYRVR